MGRCGTQLFEFLPTNPNPPLFYYFIIITFLFINLFHSLIGSTLQLLMCSR